MSNTTTARQALDMEDGQMTAHIKNMALTKTERDRLERIVRKFSAPQSLAFRAKIVLLTADGVAVTDICRYLDTTRTTVSKWKKRYLEFGFNGLVDRHRSGKPKKYQDSLYRKIVSLASLKNADGQRYWSVRGLARRLGVNRGVVQRTLLRENLEHQSA